MSDPVLFDFAWDPSPHQVSLGLEQWANEVDDFTEPFTAVVEVFRRHHKRHFDTEGASTGDVWDDLSDAYAEWKEEHYPGRPILVREGVLRAAIVEGSGAGAVTSIGRRDLLVGADDEALPYAVAHQEGDGVPQREVVRFNGDFTQVGSFGWVVAQILQAYVVWVRKRAFQKAGRIDDPFLEERFESRIVAAMSAVDAGSPSVAILKEEGLARLGLA